MWTYEVISGECRKDGILAGSGYSGFGKGKNNPALESVHGVGPIPRGDFDIILPPFDSPKTGKYVMRLIPREGTDVFGRTDLEWHGDSTEHPGQASHGCIASPRYVRVRVRDSSDTHLRVI